VASVCLMVDHSQSRIAALELGQNLGSVIPAAVVDDYDLVVVRQLSQRHVGEDHHAGDRARVVVRREKSADALIGPGQRTLPSDRAPRPRETPETNRELRVRKTSSTVIVIRQS